MVQCAIGAVGGAFRPVNDAADPVARVSAKGATMNRRRFAQTMALTLPGTTLVLSPRLAKTEAQAPPQGEPLPPGQRPGAERHPQIRGAIRALEVAKKHLESAAHDFGGHRLRALEHVNQALGECRAALEFDRK